MKFYPALTYLLIPFAILLGLMNLLSLAFVFVNPSVLIVVFGLTCFVLYSFSSLRFLNQVVKGGQILTTKFKDWIKVNAYVSLFLCSLFFINSISILISTNEVLSGFINEFLEQQSGFPAEITGKMILSILKGVSVFLLVTGIIGIVHIRTTLRLVKRYDYLFE